jgi:hypothetical protein
MDCKDYAYHWVSFYWFVSEISDGQADLWVDAAEDHDSIPMCNMSVYLDISRPTSRHPWSLAADYGCLEGILQVLCQCIARKLISICSLIPNITTINSAPNYLDECESMAGFWGFTRSVQFQRTAMTNLNGQDHAFLAICSPVIRNDIFSGEEAHSCEKYQLA